MTSSEEAERRWAGTPWNRWDGHLEEWLGAVLSTQKAADHSLIHWEFPTQALLDEYLATIHERDEEHVRAVVRKLCITSSFLGADQDRLEGLLWNAKNDPEFFKRQLQFESNRRLIAAAMNARRDPQRAAPPPWEGITWILDLLPHWPRQAIQALASYQLAHAQQLPDGRYNGIADAQAIIRARWILVGSSGDEAERARGVLLELDSRDFEHLIEALYAAMGYKTLLTKRSWDGGRDIVASRDTLGRAERVLVECKLYRDRVGPSYVRALLGVVSNERVNKGVLVTTGRFTRSSQEIARENRRIELVNAADLVILLNEHLGASWRYRVDSLIAESRRRQTLA